MAYYSWRLIINRKEEMMAVSEYNKESPIQPDIVTGGMVVIDSDHQMVHRYATFSISYYDLTVADSGTLSLGLTVPADHEIHIKNLFVSGAGYPWIFDGVALTSFTPSITYIIPFNHHMSSTAPESVVTVNVNPTGLPAQGDYKFLFGGGTGVGGTGSSGGFSPVEEFVMHPGNYLMRLTNSTGAVNEANIVMTWYEIKE